MEVLTRIKRNPALTTLEIRGTSRGRGCALVYPVLEEPALPYGFTDSIYDAISVYSPSSGRSTPQPAAQAGRLAGLALTFGGGGLGGGLDDSFCLSVSQAWTALARGQSADFTTDQSSASSGVSCDDFDREASAKMQLLFDDIDSALFERQDTPPAAGNIYHECRQWNDAFPHLRVLGKQLLPCKDAGYECVSPPRSAASAVSLGALARKSRPAVHANSSGISNGDHRGLLLEGHTLTPKPLDMCLGVTVEVTARLTEEVFEQDGCYEEVIAIDDNVEEPFIHKRNHRRQPELQRRHGKLSRYPPISPNACVKDDVSSSAFDAVWMSINAAMRPLLLRYAHTFALLPVTMAAVRPRRQRLLSSDMAAAVGGGAHHRNILDAFKFPQIISLPASRTDGAGSSAAIAAAVSRQTPLQSSGAALRPRFGSSLSTLHTHPSTAVAPVAPPTVENVRLGSILTISKKEMQAREKLYNDELSGRDTPVTSGRPGSSSAPMARKEGSSGSVAAMVAHMNAVVASQAKKGVVSTASLATGRSKLAPLPDRSQTPSVDEGLPQRGLGVSYQRLHMTGKRIASPSPTPPPGPAPVAPSSYYYRTGGVLPPIGDQSADLAAEVRLPSAAGSPSTPLQFAATRPTVRRKVIDRASSALIADQKGSHHQPSLLQQRDKQVTVGLAGASGTRPSTTHSVSGRVDVQFRGSPMASYSGTKISFTPMSIASLTKAGSMHGATYRRSKVLSSFAR